MWFFGLGFLSTGILILIFAPYTMRRIEKQAIAEHPQYRQPLDFGGGVIFYAWAIVFPERIAMRIDRLIDVRTVRNYATKTDWILALFVMVTGNTVLIVSLIAMVFGLD